MRFRAIYKIFIQVTRFLIQKLSQICLQQLTNHIKNTLPHLRNKLQKQAKEMEKEVAQYKGYDSNDPSRKTKLMLR